MKGLYRMSFKDHFSDTAAGYASFRPRYPDAFRKMRSPLRLRVGRKE